MGVLATNLYTISGETFSNIARFSSKHVIAVKQSNKDLFYDTDIDNASGSTAYAGNNLEEGTVAPTVTPVPYKVHCSVSPTSENMVYRATRGRNGAGDIVDSISRRNISTGATGVVPADVTNGFIGGYKDFFAYKNVSGTVSRVAVVRGNELQIYNQNLAKVNTRGSIGASTDSDKYIYVGYDVGYVISDSAIVKVDLSTPGTGLPLLDSFTSNPLESRTSTNCRGFVGLTDSAGKTFLFILNWNGLVSSPAQIFVREGSAATGAIRSQYSFNMPGNFTGGQINLSVHPTGQTNIQAHTMPVGQTQFDVMVSMASNHVNASIYNCYVRGLRMTVITGSSSTIDYGTVDLGRVASSSTINDLFGSDPGYRFVISGQNGSGTAEVRVYSYSFVADAVITSQSGSQTVNVGSNMTLSVTATGDSISYQWKKNGSNISGATSSSYTINNVQASDAATYTCTVSNSVSSVTTTNIVITVSTPITITSQPVSVIVDSLTPAVFSVTATGSTPTYQWKKNGSNISGATSSTYTISTPSISDTATYSVAVTNANGTVTSNSVQLSFISLQPQPQSALIGNSVHFSVSASGGTISYQWKKNNVNIPGATSSTYTIPSVVEEDETTYLCTISNGSVSAPSLSVALSIIPPGPINIVMECGEAGGYVVQTRQWFKNGVIITGQVGSTFTENTSQQNGTNYYCELIGPEGQRQVTILHRIFNEKPYRVGLQYLKFLSNVNNSPQNLEE